MIEIDGVEYLVNTAEENADSALAATNEHLVEQNVQTEEGVQVQIEKNWANPLWLLFYGVGTLISYVQNLLVSAANAINLNSASERQLLNLAAIAGITRKTATKTTVLGTVYADLENSCTITTTDTCSYNGVTYAPAFDISLAAGESATIIFVAEEDGSYTVPANTLAFEATPTGLRSMVTQASVPGQAEETIAQLRYRMQNRTVSFTAQERAQEAISQLDGVTVASVYFNPSISNTVTVNEISVPPRQALIFVQGYSAGIAQAFYSHMLCEVAGQEAPNAIIQTYVTKGGQVIPVAIQTPAQITAKIRVYMDTLPNDVTLQAYKDTICTLGQQQQIGNPLTAMQVLNVLQEAYPSKTFVGAKVATGDSLYAQKATCNTYELIVFAPSNIEFLAGGTE